MSHPNANPNFPGINNGASFKNKLKGATLSNMITTTAQLLTPTFNPPSMLNVAFTASGFRKMGLNETASVVGDSNEYGPGQFAEAAALVRCSLVISLWVSLLII